MRVKEKIEKAGYFWLPSAPEKKIPGTLIITDGGNIELEVVGLFGGNDSPLRRVGGIGGDNQVVVCDADCSFDRIIGDVGSESVAER